MIWIALCLLVYLVSPYSLIGNVLRDLETNDAASFANDAALWDPSPGGLVDGVTKVSFCFNNYLLGGYNILRYVSVYFERSYTNLPIPHNMLHFTFLAQPVDSWDSGDTFGVQFDSNPLMTGWKFSTYTSYTAPSVCGNPSFSDFPGLKTIIELPHTADTLRVRVYSIFDQVSTDESFGFRDISILFYNSSNPLTSQTFCGQTTMALPFAWCPCIDTNFYMSPAKSGTCLPCDITCASCSGSANNQCLSCYTNSYLSGGRCYSCDGMCMNCTAPGPYGCSACAVGKFLIPNGACDSFCPAPLYQSTDGNNVLCTTACPNQYVYWDESCSAGCAFPLEPLLIDNYFQVCSFPCEEHQYLYWDGTCSDSCPYPLTSRTFHSRLFCDYKCLSNEFVYWDGSCQGSCNPPLSYHTEGITGYTRYICDYPCNITEYLYWNGSCLATCDLPISASISRQKNFCSFPCSSAALPILYWDGSCSDECNLPKILVSEGNSMIREFCQFPCGIDEFLYWNGTCSKICVPPLVSHYQNSRSFCEYPCLSSEYLNWDGSCIPSCNSPPLSIRLESGLLYCDYPCPSEQPYLYWNGSCLGDCLSPLQLRKQGPALFCEYPCSASVNFLYWNGTCSLECDHPLTKRIEGTPARQFCDFGCEDYLYWNQTCGSECSPPLLFRAVVGKKYCDYPCSRDEYLYWNSSCLSDCNTPLKILEDGSVNYCVFPCSSDEYLNWDGTCSLNCLAPLEQYIEGEKKYCLSACLSSAEYLYPDGSCSNSCRAPMRIRNQTTVKNDWQLFCDLPCTDPSHYYFAESQTCSSVCPSEYIIQNYSNYLICDKIKEDGWLVRNFLTEDGGIVTLVRLMRYIGYIDMPMSPRLEKLVEAKARNIFSLNIGWSMSDEMLASFIEKPLPSVFEKNGLTSNFVVNFWKNLTWLLTVFIVGIVVAMLENVFRIFGQPALSCFFEKLRSLFKWNLLLILIAISVDDITLYSFLQFLSLGEYGEKASQLGEKDSLYMVFSFLGCLAALGLGIVYMGFIVFLVWRCQLALNVARQVPEDFAIDETVINQRSFVASLEFDMDWQDYRVLYKGYRTNCFSQQLFYFLYILRACWLPMLFAFCLYSYPITQTVLQTVLNGLLIFYLFLKKPLKNRINHWQVIIGESIILMGNFCAFLLACLLDSGLDYSTQSLVILADIVIFSNFAFNAMLVLFFMIKLIVEGKKIFKNIKDTSIKEAIAWLDLLTVWFQQGGMGFEEIRDQGGQVIYKTDNNHHKYVEFASNLSKSEQRPIKKSFAFPTTNREDLSISELNVRDHLENCTTVSPIITETTERHLVASEDVSASKRLRVSHTRAEWANYLKQLSIGKEINLQDLQDDYVVGGAQTIGSRIMDQTSPVIKGLELISPIQSEQRNTELNSEEYSIENMRKRPRRRIENISLT